MYFCFFGKLQSYDVYKFYVHPSYVMQDSTYTNMTYVTDSEKK
jgi:hypothetical protein